LNEPISDKISAKELVAYKKEMGDFDVTGLINKKLLTMSTDKGITLETELVITL